MSRLTRDGTAGPVSRDQILRREQGQRNIDFPCSADHGQDWQPYPVDLSLAICDTIPTYLVHTYGLRYLQDAHIILIVGVAKKRRKLIGPC